MATTTSTQAIRPGSPELRELLARIAAGAEERERELKAPFEAIGWIKDAGLGRLRIPVDAGGGGATVRELFETVIALAEADSNVAHILRTHYWFVEQQIVSADPDDRARGIALLNSGALVGNGFSEQSSHPVGLYFDTKFTPDPRRRLPPARDEVLLDRHSLLGLHPDLGGCPGRPNRRSRHPYPPRGRHDRG
jgi:hypothetical protein